jgi:hypothetical protein
MSSRRLTCLVPIATCALALALPSLASANDYCVDTECDGAHVDTLEQAFDLADDKVDHDRILLGPKVYSPQQTNSPFTYNSVGSVEIVGAGRNRTYLTAPGTAAWVLSLTGGDGSSIHDLTIRLPAFVSQGMEGFRTTNDARRVDVTQDPSQLKDHTGLMLYYGGTFEDGTVDMGNWYSTALKFAAGGGTLRDSTIYGHNGVKVWYGDATIERSRVVAYADGVQADRGLTTISDSLIHLTGTQYGGAGIRSNTTLAGGADSTVKADGLTIVCPNKPDYDGVSASNVNASGYSAEVDLTNSVIRGGGTSLSAYGGSGIGGAVVRTSYSDYDSTTTKHLGGGAGFDEKNVTNVGDPGFVDAANGDFRLTAASKLIDAGDPASPQGLDLDRNPLVTDGNADGMARRDIGGYELQPPAPAGGGEPGGGQPAPDTVAPVISAFRARGTRVRYTLSEPARVALVIKRARGRGYRTIATLRRGGKAGPNVLRLSKRVARRLVRQGRYRAIITATDTAGNRSAARAIRLRIARGSR